MTRSFPTPTPRAAAQTARIVEMLRSSPRFNFELAQIALKYTSRISDARKAGYVIECDRMLNGDGRTLYTLVGEPSR